VSFYKVQLTKNGPIPFKPCHSDHLGIDNNPRKKKIPRGRVKIIKSGEIWSPICLISLVQGLFDSVQRWLWDAILAWNSHKSHCHEPSKNLRVFGFYESLDGLKGKLEWVHIYIQTCRNELWSYFKTFSKPKVHQINLIILGKTHYSPKNHKNSMKLNNLYCKPRKLYQSWKTCRNYQSWKSQRKC